MCVSCGCGNQHDDHGDPRNITMQAIDAAAQAAGTTREKVMKNLSGNASSYQPSSGTASSNSQPTTASGGLQDGYGDTAGSNYDQSTGNTQQAQAGYDPGQSGVRQAQNQPGTRVEAPGRETGTAWAEEQQMGSTTDTSDRGNPAN